jgi:CBS domain-containing protein
MPTVQDILSLKGSKVHTVLPTASVLEATEKMNRNKIGALIVVDSSRPIGIFTERDVLQRVVGAMQRPDEIPVSAVMTADLICCRPDDDINEVAALMKNERIRHVPVCNEDGDLLGLISIGDVNAHHASAQQAQIHYLNEYIYGRV